MWNESTQDLDDISYEEKMMPAIYTPINDIDLLRNKRLVLIIWYVDELVKEQKVIG
jgi:hypothetical protein